MASSLSWILVTFLVLLGFVGVIKGNRKMIQLKQGKFVPALLLIFSIIFLTSCSQLPTESSNNTEQPATINHDRENQRQLESVQEDKIQQSAETSLQTPSRSLAVHFVNVGQGAAQVIITPNQKVMVIDAGNNDDETKMVEYLTKLGVEKIDILIGTHPDADHIGGLDAVIENFEIGSIYMPNVSKNTQTFEHVLMAIQNKGLKVSTAKSGLDLKLDTRVNVKMIAPISSSEDHNEMSAVVRLEYGKHSFLLTGDAGKSTETELIQSGATLESTVLLVGHHGSDYSTSVEFLQKVKPQFAVIQVGENNYGHPSANVLKHLDDRKSEIFRNDRDGTVIFSTDGTTMQIKKQSGESNDNEINSDSIAGQEKNEMLATAVIDETHPPQNGTVTVTVTVTDTSGQPVSGAHVLLDLAFKSKNTIYESVTNASGVSLLTFRIGRAQEGYPVQGEITATNHEKTATARILFTPQ
jgi:beta-lactamase superfamily II metal-dependent hydrolase